MRLALVAYVVVPEPADRQLETFTVRIECHACPGLRQCGGETDEVGHQQRFAVRQRIKPASRAWDKGLVLHRREDRRMYPVVQRTHVGHHTVHYSDVADAALGDETL